MLEALASGTDVVEVYVEPDAPIEVRFTASAAGVRVVEVATGSLAQVTSPVSPQPVAALAAIPAPAMREELRGLLLVLVGVADPGNAGTLIRVAEAAGVSAVVSCADAVDFWNPKCIRASAGSAFRVPLRDAGSLADCMAELRAAEMTVFACAAGAATTHDHTDLRGNVAILLGNEAHGLTPETVALADRVLSIPMAGAVESLNVAMTGTIIAFEASRQRRAAGEQ